MNKTLSTENGKHRKLDIRFYVLKISDSSMHTNNPVLLQNVFYDETYEPHNSTSHFYLLSCFSFLLFIQQPNSHILADDSSIQFYILLSNNSLTVIFFNLLSSIAR